MEPLQPLAVVDIAFGPPLHLLHLLGIDKQDLEATALQQLKEWNPITPVDSNATVVMRHVANQSASAA